MSAVAAGSANDDRGTGGSTANAVLPLVLPRPRALPRRAHRGLETAQWLIVAVAVAAFVGFAALPWLGAYRTLTVLSGSMRPTFSAGDVIISRARPMSELRVGDVITYHIPIGDRHLETHRVVALWRRNGRVFVETAGDANRRRDPWRARLLGDTVWREVAVIPKVGWAIVWLREPVVRKLGLYGASLLLVIVGLLAIWRRDDERASVAPEAVASAGSDTSELAGPTDDVRATDSAEHSMAAAPPRIADVPAPPSAAVAAPAPPPRVQARGQWNIRDLESLVAQPRAALDARSVEWGFYVDAMRDLTDAAGWLPETLDWLVWDTFGELLTIAAFVEDDVAAQA